MSRPLRIQFPGACYHVMNRGTARQKVFLDKNDFHYFLVLLDEIWKRWEVQVYAFCLLSNHYHIFLQTPQGNLSRCLRHVDGLYTQHFNRIHGRDGSLFRGRYKAILVDREPYLLQLVRYIHLNPVKAGLVGSPVQYPWSSHQIFLSNRKPPSWLAKKWVLQRFGSKSPLVFDRFVCEGNEKFLEDFYQRKRYSPVLGSPAFLRRILPKISTSKFHSRAERRPHLPDIETVVERVGKTFGVRPQDILKGRRRVENMPRNMAIYIAGRHAGFPHFAIRKYFGIGTNSGVSQICYTMSKKILKDSRWENVLEKILNKY